MENKELNKKSKSLNFIQKIQRLDKDTLKKKLKRHTPMTIWVFIRFFLLIGLGFVLVYPLIYMFSNAIRPLSEINDPSVIWIPKELTLDNFDAAIGALDYYKSIQATFIIGMGSAIITVFSASFIGYGLARFNFRGKNILFLLVIVSILVPPQILVMPTSLNFRNFDLLGIIPFFESIVEGILKVLGESKDLNWTYILNTKATFYIPALLGCGIRGGLFIFIFTQFYRNMPTDLDDAAKVDGCKPLQTYFRVMMPNAVVIFVTVFLFSIVWYWNDYFISSIYYTKDVNTISVSLSKIRIGLNNLQLIPNDRPDPNEIRSYLQAGSLLTIAPILFIYLIFQKYFIESVERSGIVG